MDLHVNAERQPLLQEHQTAPLSPQCLKEDTDGFNPKPEDRLSQETGSTDDDTVVEGTTKKKKKAAFRESLTAEEALHRRRWLAVHCCVLGIIAGFAMFVLLVTDADEKYWPPEKAAGDACLLLVSYSIVAFVLYGLMTLRQRRGPCQNKLQWTTILHHVAVAAFIASSGKVWVYEWSNSFAPRLSTTDNVFQHTAVVLAVAVPLCSMWLNNQIHRVDVPSVVTMRYTFLLQILRPYFVPAGAWNKAMVLVTWGLLAGGKLCGVVAPIFLARGVTRMTADPSESPNLDFFIFTTLTLAPRVLEEVQEVTMSTVWRTAYVQVADRTFRHVHSLSLDWHLRKKMGQVIRYMDRGMDAAELFVQYIIMYIGPALAIAVSVFVVFATEFRLPRVAATCYVGVALYAWVTVVVTIVRREYFEETNEHDNEMHDKSTDALINFETVKYFTAEDSEALRYRKSVEENQRQLQKSRVSIALLNVVQATLNEYCRFACLVLAAVAVMQHEEGFTIGKFMALQAYLVMVFQPFAFLGSVYEMGMESLVDMDNLADLLAEEPDMVDLPGARPLTADTTTRLSLEFRNVSFHYPTQSPASGLKDVSFTVPAGTTTAIVGKTGSGKTTITRLLFRFYDTIAGAVLIDGTDVRDVTQRSLRQHIGIVPQDTVLFNDTIRANIAYGKPNATMDEVVEAARQAQLLDFIEGRMDKGWDTMVGERGLKLSGGEKQRVAIARCLLKNPPVVVLDEATSALDNRTEAEVQVALRSLSGRTTVIVAHRLTTVRHADEILVMSEGRVLERGTFDVLMANAGGCFHGMWHAQASVISTSSDSNGMTPPPAASNEDGILE